MAKNEATTVDEYLAAQPEAVRGVLERVRSVIRKALPGAEEVISYQIPTYKIHGGAVLYFAGWKQHFSLYPAGEALVEALGAALAGYVINKGTIRFPFSKAVPVALIKRIAQFRAKEVTAGEEVKGRAKKAAKTVKKAAKTAKRAATNTAKKAATTAKTAKRAATNTAKKAATTAKTAKRAATNTAKKAATTAKTAKRAATNTAKKASTTAKKVATRARKAATSAKEAVTETAKKAAKAVRKAASA